MPRVSAAAGPRRPPRLQTEGQKRLPRVPARRSARRQKAPPRQRKDDGRLLRRHPLPSRQHPESSLTFGAPAWQESHLRNPPARPPESHGTAGTECLSPPKGSLKSARPKRHSRNRPPNAQIRALPAKRRAMSNAPAWQEPARKAPRYLKRGRRHGHRPPNPISPRPRQARRAERK